MMSARELEQGQANRQPRLLNLSRIAAKDQDSDQPSIFSTRSSVDRSHKSSISRAEFTFRNSDLGVACKDCLKLRLMIDEIEKTKIADYEKTESHKRYMKQMTSLLEIKANRLKEEEIILKTERESLHLLKEELMKKDDEQRNKWKDKMFILEKTKRDYDKKMIEIESKLIDFKEGKKNLKTNIKKKLIEKFELRETILLKTQQELDSKEQGFRKKCMDQNTNLKKIEEILAEREKIVKDQENNSKIFREGLILKKKVLESFENHERKINLKSKEMNLKLREMMERIKKLKTMLKERDVIIRKSKKIDFRDESNNEEMNQLKNELADNLNILQKLESDVKIKEQKAEQLIQAAQNKQEFLEKLEKNIEKMIENNSATKKELDQLSLDISQQVVIQKIKERDYQSSLAGLKRFEDELFLKSQALQDTEILLNKQKSLLIRKHQILNAKVNN